MHKNCIDRICDRVSVIRQKVIDNDWGIASKYPQINGVDVSAGDPDLSARQSKGG